MKLKKQKIEMSVFSSPPTNLCVLRLSAIGDISHTLPVVRTIQAHWPETRITWIIGKTEYNLVKEISDINFIVFDKSNGFKEYLKIFTLIRHTKFDVLLHMQMSLRASLISLLIKAKTRIGFDRPRAKDLQWLFTNTKIKYRPQQHVIDSLFGFTETLGIKEKLIVWDIPILEHEQQSSQKLLNGTSKYIVISPCSSKEYRNWHTHGYAAIADYIKEKYQYEVVLTGGKSSIENEYGAQIEKLCVHKPLNLIGKTNLKELLSILKFARCLISPDSGPAHLSTTVATPVIGLYASTNPDRARPYLSKKWLVNCYPEAVAKKYHKNVSDVAWGKRVRDRWAMELISVDSVKKVLDQLMLSEPDSK